MDRIVQVTEFSTPPPPGHRISGLNIFAANRIDVPFEQDPRVVFLSTLSRSYPCSANVSTVALEGETPTEYFKQAQDGVDYREVTIGPSIYGYYHWPSNPTSLFFPDAAMPFFGTDAEGYEYLVRCDALALLVGPRKGGVEEAERLLKAPFTDHATVVTALTQFYEVVLTSYDDGWGFEVHAQDPRSVELLDGAIAAGVAQIEATPWFIENRDRLVWDSEGEHCYMLPELIRPPKDTSAD